MTIPYYKDDEDKYPPQVLAIIDRIKLYFSEQAYFNDTLAVALKRFIVADMDEESSLREATSFFGTNQKYPFTAYNVGDLEPVTSQRNGWAKGGTYFSDYFSAKIDAKPVKQLFPMMSFFNNPYDYDTFKKILEDIRDSPIKMEVPITINGIEDTFTIEIKFTDISKGGLAFEIQEQLVKNKLYNLNHGIEVYYHDYVVKGAGDPVEFLTHNFKERDPEDSSLDLTIESGVAQATPILQSSDPVNDSIDVPVENSIILTFNVGMDEESVENHISVNPYFGHYLTWDEDSLNLLIDPHENLESGTVYVVAIEKNEDVRTTARSWFNEENIEENIYLTFKTI